MKAKTLGEIEASIEQLDVSDQVRLLQFLAPKIANAILSPQPSASERDPSAAWLRYRALGDRLAATSIPGAASLTEEVSKMRR
jgi:hypothetical protein